ncbi:MAG: cupredoxin domain-containing protein [Acidimicrobiia bacterium]
MRRPNLLVLASLATTSLVLAACGDTDDHAGMPMSDSAMDDGMHDDGMGHDETTPVVEGARRIEVTARSFEFDPDEITITAGEDIAIVLTSEDMLHDFTVDGLDAHVVAEADGTVEGGLRADDPGRYSFYCTVPGHRDAGMEGTLIVEAP